MDVFTEAGSFSRIFIDGCGRSNKVGEPEMPVAVNMLEIPFCRDYVLNIYEKEFVIYDAHTLGINYPVYPVQRPLSKSHNGLMEFTQNINTYESDTFYELPLAQFEEVGLMRNVNVGTLYVAPVHYNPVTQEIKIYKSIDVEILFNKTELVKTHSIKELHNSPLFNPSYIVNSFQKCKAEFANVPIKYLIVSHSLFRGELDEFIAWKRRKGFLVEIGYTDEENVGTTTSSIAAFIQSHYDDATPDNPAPTFVLLVGDVQQIPTFTGAGIESVHPTDLYYFTWAGGNIPCCYYGRFSAQNISQLVPQIRKTLQYEQYRMPDPNYLNDIVLIAGYDDTEAVVYGNGFVNYVTQYYANKEYGYKSVYAHYHPCSSDADRIRAEIGRGVGIANYTAHCNELGWANPVFYKSHISAMNNVNKYGLMIGNCCLSNRFDYSECFGEALLRAAEKGAVGYIGASNNTYWDEDYFWSLGLKNYPTLNPVYSPSFLGAYDRLFHTHGENYDKWMTTFGSMNIAGNEAVQTSTSTLKQYYWEIYHLMGDPSVMTYLTKPRQMKAELPAALRVGENTLSAKVAPYSYCALTDCNGSLIGAGFSNENGIITLRFNSMATGEYEFAAWAQNNIQFFQKIQCKKMPCLISPIPASDMITIETENPLSSYEIFDINGRKITSKQNINDKITQVNFASFAAGIYIIKTIDNTQQTYIQKFIKK